MNNKKLNSHMDLLRKELESLLVFLKAKFPMFHNSNFFYRDLQYGIRSFMEKKDIIISYAEADELAGLMFKDLEDKKIFVRVNNNSWKINYPEFVTTEPGDPL